MTNSPTFAHPPVSIGQEAGPDSRAMVACADRSTNGPGGLVAQFPAPLSGRRRTAPLTLPASGV